MNTPLRFLLLIAIVFTLLPLAWAGADEWPQWRGPGRDGLWHEEGVVERFEGQRLEPRWSAPIGSGYSSPTVAEGRVYVTDRADEGEGDTQIERVHCFDRKTGEKLWTHRYECEYGEIGYQAGPRAAVLVEEGRAYSLGASGYLHCFDAETGEVLWERDLKERYAIRMPNWGIASSPLVEGDRLILHIGGENATLVALDKETGEERWTAFDDEATYSAPIVITQGDRRVVACWTADHLVGVDARSGEVLWAHAIERERWPIAIPSPVRYKDFLFLTSIHEGSYLFRAPREEPTAELVWAERGPTSQRTVALHSLLATPLILDGYIYGVGSRGELRCLDLTSGERVWSSEEPVPTARWASMHLVHNTASGRTWIFNERGELIIARLSPDGYEEIDRAKLIEPTRQQLPRRGGVTWSHPAFAHRHVFARNDEKLVCVDLSAE